ncbi:MAG: acyl-CoA dehydrogenase [Vreelandella alkaliphila]|uniref:3-methylmercaptopropionyl-CoA dehydrogenase n=1 Tax=Halomonas campaniensis TaxID=213554 RepID=A0A3D0KB70_9GAMM|nr:MULTISPECIES: acyl-CoA dehydrogenase [unclassified Halomonas]WKD29391.1 acyl-CoA dehydrogenase [Halomonas sp. KG2]HBP42368.1 acyl-CoA dehydrogenase [Halomonas sp.]HCA00802.1 acyl-CoA dehydrogenase [Halomonas campaniensis]
MNYYAAPVRDLRFVLEELLAHRSLALPGFEEATPDLVEAVLEEAAKLAGDVWGPLNSVGDRQGAKRHTDGSVTTSEGFAAAYQAYVEGGWNGIGVSEALGGQNLPEVVASAVQEMLHGANMALGLCPMLTAGAIEALAHHGSETLKTTYLPKLVEGTWTGTMNLTEPQAGSDLSKVRTKAIPEGDHYRISGQKIYITWGEHDAAENIIHLVLARKPDAPEGNKGISLFLVPKFLVNADGSLGERNDVTCASIEHKLGIHGSPTCTLSFGENDGAIGYLVGEEGRGLNHMFTMMNEARHKVGIQGIGVAERACQHAFAYALDRTQGRAPKSRGGNECSISDHLDVRRMLLSMRARTDALRALALYCAGQLDLARHSESDSERQAAQACADVLIPIVKSFSTDQAVDIASMGIQVHGGMGYVEETGAAQLLRDARIAPIYEGTNGIQALDLAGRKLQRDGGAALSALIDEVQKTAETMRSEPNLAVMGSALAVGADDLRAAMQLVLEQGSDPQTGPDAVQAYATPLLNLAGHVLCAWQMGNAALHATRALQKGSDEPFYRVKLSSANFVITQWLPAGRAQRAVIEAGMQCLSDFELTP